MATQHLRVPDMAPVWKHRKPGGHVLSVPALPLVMTMEGWKNGLVKLANERMLARKPEHSIYTGFSLINDKSQVICPHCWHCHWDHRHHREFNISALFRGRSRAPFNSHRRRIWPFKTGLDARLCHYRNQIMSVPNA